MAYKWREMMDNRLTVECLTRVLGTCFLVAAALILVWFVFYLVAGEFAYAIHAKLFGIDRRQFEAINYYGMAFIKLLAFVLFLVPYIALKITGNRKGQSA